jgi:long-chain acyl-CoA synthetase
LRGVTPIAVCSQPPMHATTSSHLSRPWQQQYGTSIRTDLPPPSSPHLAAMAREAARRFAAQTAFTCVMPNGMYGSLSYAQVDEMSDAFAKYLRGTLGLAAGDRVAIQMPNSLAYPVALLGVLKAGCVAVNTNPLYTAREMQHQFADSGARAIVIVDLFADKLEQILGGTKIEHVVIARVPEFFPPVVQPIVYGVMKWWNRAIPAHGLKVTRLPEALVAGRALPGDAAAYTADSNHDTLALLQYTGGTTGVAKGAMLTHGNLLWNLEQMLAMCASHIDEGKEVVLTALPLYHIFAFTVNFLAMFRAGARNILVPSPRPIGNLQRAIENYRITWLTGVNTLYNALLNEEWFTAFPPKHIKAAGGGGAAMHAAVVERWQQVTGAPLVEGYGLTESAPVVCFQPLNAPRAPDTIGIPAPMTDVRLVDDEGRDVKPGEPGELIVRGPQIMRGYWNKPEDTAQVLRDGWLYTGDVAVMSADGTFKIVDRKKDLILVSGFNVYPNEIEAVRAVVVKRDPALSGEALLAHCRTLLTNYKVPARIEFRDELPKTAVGKILRRELRTDILSRKD